MSDQQDDNQGNQTLLQPEHDDGGGLQFSLNLDPDGVGAPATQRATLAAQVVASCIQALDREALYEPPEQLAGFIFSGLNLGKEQRRELYLTWLLGNAFEDLARGVRESLEEAFVFCDVLNNLTVPITMESYKEFISKIRRRANTYNFPDLLSRVSVMLTSPLTFEAEFDALQRARNCLQHRRGIVGEKDLNSGDEMVIRIPRFVVGIRDGEKGVDFLPGQENATSLNGQNERQVEVNVKRELHERRFKIGTRFTLGIADFGEFAMACHMFAIDIVARLPMSSSTSTS